MKIRFVTIVMLASVLLAACSLPSQAPVVVEAPSEQSTAPAAAESESEAQIPAAEEPVIPAEPAAPTGDPRELVVMTHDSFAVSDGVIQEFEIANNAKVTFLRSGDAGSTLNKAILTKDAPIADVLFGVDNTFLSRALDAEIFETYASPLLQNIPDEYRLDQKNRALPVDYGDVCINYSVSFFQKNDLPVPSSFDDLIDPAYYGLLVVENPATSSPGLAFLLATIERYGDPGYLDYWRALKENGVVVVDGWETAYYTNFSGSAGFGPQPLVVSYSSSPAAEIVFAETQLSEAPTASITAPGMCFRQVEFVGILKGSKQPELAQAFVDFMLNVPFQEGMPLTMFVYPVNYMATTPDVFNTYGQPASQPSYAPKDLDANRDNWISAWTSAVLE